MAREVAYGQTAVLYQMEQQAKARIVEQAAQVDRTTIMYANAEQQIFSLENLVRVIKTKAEEGSQLLSGTVSAVYVLEGETSRLQQTINMRCEEITQLTRTNEEMQQSWTTTMNANVTLRAQLSLAESSFTAEQRDASTRLPEDLRLRNELSVYASRDAVLKHELQVARNQILLEAQTFRNQFGRAQDELAEAVEHLKVSRASLEFHEQQSFAWQ
jgi:hypothetical protein